MTRESAKKAGKPARPWHREPYVWMMILIPGAAVIMGVVMISLAVATYDGLVVDDYYKKGLEINRSLARDKAARRYGLGGTLHIDPDNGTVELTLAHAADYRPPPVLTIGLFHATRAGHDQSLSLERVSPDRYDGHVPKLPPGSWNFQIEADDWRLNGSLRVPGNGKVRINADLPS
jgi:uncharacterized protein